MRRFLLYDACFIKDDMLPILLVRARQNVETAGVPVSVLAVVCELRRTTWSSAYRGTMNLGGQKESELFTTSCRLLELAQALAPLQIPREADDVSRMLRQLEGGAISLEEIRDMKMR